MGYHCNPDARKRIGSDSSPLGASESGSWLFLDDKDEEKAAPQIFSGKLLYLLNIISDEDIMDTKSDGEPFSPVMDNPPSYSLTGDGKPCLHIRNTHERSGEGSE
jgi:hypothetical protein